jgi:hypothetical protein
VANDLEPYDLTAFFCKDRITYKELVNVGQYNFTNRLEKYLEATIIEF